MSEVAIKIENLSKTFNKRSKIPTHALKDVNIEIKKGDVTGLIGPNGAGKTTLIRILNGFLNKDKGKVSVFGYEPNDLRVKKLMGYQSDLAFKTKRINIYSYLAVLSSLAGYKKNTEQIRYLLESFHMTGAAEKKLSDLSKGMRQKIELCAAFIGEPQLVVLDEPTAGLDPPSVFELRDFLVAKKRDGMSILFSSHNLTEVENTCDSVLFIKDGEISAKYKMEERGSGFLEDAFQNYLKNGGNSDKNK